jgi:CRISPR type IV-associated protein Csf1
MQATALIAQHLSNKGALKIEQVQTICAFSGVQITEGVALKNVLSANFTDAAYVRHPSKYCAVDVAQCFAPVTDGGKASLRNFSFIATQSALTMLKREDMQAVLLSEKETPFVLCVSYNQKKHISYKSRPQYDSDNFTVFTDAGEVQIIQKEVANILPIITSWYSVVKGKEETAALPTYFTKDEILTGEVSTHKIIAYGEAKFFRETAVLEKYRRSNALKFIVHVLQKTKSNA